ncbi:hypothetical protein [Phenylobacterium sp.]|uniref:hypothetical protein n=1 Tax=Phenylobacterium sp. TaxID=1871053 RepID=UPI003565A141
MPTPGEVDDYFVQIKAMSDREAVLAQSAFLDTFLEQALSWCMVTAPSDNRDRIFRDPGSPLGSFSARILLAEALGVVSPAMRAQLDVIRRIRNVFAHTVRPLDFENRTLAEEAAKLDPGSMTRPGFVYQTGVEITSRTRFNDTSTFVIRHVIEFIGARHKGAVDGSWPVVAAYQSTYA